MRLLSRYRSGRRRLPTCLPSRCSLRHPREYSAGVTTLPSRLRRLFSVYGDVDTEIIRDGTYFVGEWRTNWSFAEAGVVVPRCSEGMRMTQRESRLLEPADRGGADPRVLRSSELGKARLGSVDCSRCANVRRGPRDLLPLSSSRHCPESGSMLDMDMCRPGDAATLCPETSASTLFQCAERSDAQAPGLPNPPCSRTNTSIAPLPRAPAAERRYRAGRQTSA